MRTDVIVMGTPTAELRLAPVGDEPDPLLRRMSAADHLRGDPS